jgi:uncharacterized protein YbaP (TraB family)
MPSSAGQASSTEVQPTVQAEKKPDNSHPLFLWKAKRKDQTVYLLGTIHVAKPTFYPLPQEIENAANESKVLFVEVDVAQADKSKILESLKERGTYRPPETLSKNLSPQVRAILDEYLKWSGESIGIYDAWKPWVVTEVLSASAIRRAGYKGDLGIDLHLLKEAHAAKKKIVSLESADSQLKLMESFDKSTQEKMLAAEVLSFKDVSKEVNTITDAWCHGDLNKMATLWDPLGGANDLKEAKIKLLDARNRSMADTLEKSLPESGVSMVAVGAAHFAGSNGLLEILKQRGFEINQICADRALQNKQTISFGGSNLERLYYPEGRFRVMLPGQPEMKCNTLSGIRMVDYTYPEFSGNFEVSYLILPREIPDATAQQNFLNFIIGEFVKKINAKLLSKTSFSNSYGIGSQLDCKLPLKVKMTNQDVLMRLRFQLCGRMLYIIGGQGTAPWIGSNRLAQVMNSLEIVPEQSANSSSDSRSATSQTNNFGRSSTSSSLSSYSRPPSYNSSYHSNFSSNPGFHSNWTNSSDLMRKTTDSWGADQRSRMEETQRRVRESFERTRQQLQNY